MGLVHSLLLVGTEVTCLDPSLALRGHLLPLVENLLHCELQNIQISFHIKPLQTAVLLDFAGFNGSLLFTWQDDGTPTSMLHVVKTSHYHDLIKASTKCGQGKENGCCHPLLGVRVVQTPRRRGLDGSSEDQSHNTKQKSPSWSKKKSFIHEVVLRCI